MNILAINYGLKNPQTPSFGVRTPKVKTAKIKELTSDVVEISSNSKKKEFILPSNFDFKCVEVIAKDLVKKLRRLEMDAKVQKSNLRSFYSAQDKYDYQELLKEKRNVQSQLNRLSKKNGYGANGLEHIVEEKMQYNYFAPKIYKADSIEALEKLRRRVEESKTHSCIKELLFDLIESRKKLI